MYYGWQLSWWVLSAPPFLLHCSLTGSMSWEVICLFVLWVIMIMMCLLLWSIHDLISITPRFHSCRYRPSGKPCLCFIWLAYCSKVFYKQSVDAWEFDERVEVSKFKAGNTASSFTFSHFMCKESWYTKWNKRLHTASFIFLRWIKIILQVEEAK